MKDYTFFYIIKPIFKTVSKKEFEQFIKNYPRKLVYDIFGAYEPPFISYNDFELANRWPYSIVAKCLKYNLEDKNDYYYGTEEQCEFSIMINYEEVFSSKTGNQVEN